MEDINKAIKRLSSGSIAPFEADCDEICGIAIKALERQLPKQVEKMTYQLLKNSGWEHQCPICKCAIGLNRNAIDYTQDDEYCPTCGQHLKWS